MYNTKAFLEKKRRSAPKRKLSHLEQSFVNFAKSIPERKKDPDQSKIIKIDRDEPAVEYLIPFIQGYEAADVLVTVQERVFVCHTIILCIYSRRMLKILQEDIENVVFKSNDLSPKGFSEAYLWMISTDAEVNPCDMDDILRAAYFLDIPELLEACWANLDGCASFEIAAFSQLFNLRAATNLSDVFDKLVGRISTSILPAASTREFLCLNEMQICSILKSNFLAVNSEMELLYSALMWLAHLWPERRSSTYPVLNQIRYCFMPPIMLKKIRGEELQETPHFIDILKEFSKSPGVVQHLRDAVFESSLLISVRNDPSVLKTQLEFKEVKIKESRHWIQDHTCDYHRQVTPLCPNMHFITLKEYQDYLKRLTLGPEFNACLEYTGDGKSEEPQDS
ncbi:uncharacterized protein LOC117146429 [Drosophila mauritiana]|uniref:Uncharacterized protein LOC117146429 n=1 Tax=Drosophila mauritiana TaxID=7226 RepID=A0A6P8KMW1_DROMA|nr:uncharacterized protein LOC117146429 [Drosophila mauritiana]